MNKILFSSKRIDWETPQDFFDKLNAEFHFTLDPCATHENHKCPRYFTEEVDGLTQSWSGYRVFCNPPYGREIGKWVKKCYDESLKPDTVVVLLIPARTDTKWWHEYCVLGEIRFIKGRLKFKGLNSKGEPCQYPATFPSVVIIFSNNALSEV